MAYHFSKFPGNGAEFRCPICDYSSKNENSVSIHINANHPAGSIESLSTKIISSFDRECPFCTEIIIGSGHTSTLLDEHANLHFDNCNDADFSQKEQQETNSVETGSIRQFHTNYGLMSRTATNSTADNMTVQNSIIDFNWPIRDFMNRVHLLSSASTDTVQSLVCSAVDFFATCPDDRGFGCGYRNTQMLLSSFSYRPEFRRLLWTNGDVRMHSIQQLQRLIENAWRVGFDAFGAQKLDGRLLGTRKWIGATEVATLMHFHRISCRVVDFHRPTGPEGTHPLMFDWIWRHFNRDSTSEFVPPLYLQHQGHSRTIIGVERTSTRTIRLLILDPSFDRRRIVQLANSRNENDVTFLRRSIEQMNWNQFQVVVVDRPMNNDQEYEDSKQLTGQNHMRIPND